MTKQAVLFLPGFMCDHRLFGPQTAALTQAGFSCHHGDQSCGISLQGIAQNILKTAPKRFAAIGLSMGGLVALELYKQAPDRITHLALLNTTAREDAAGAARKEQLKRVAAGELSLVLQEDLKPQYLHPDHRTPQTLRLLDDMGQTLGKNVFCSQTIALQSRASYLDLLPNVACSAMAIAGEDDAVCPIDRHQEIATRIPDCSLEILPRCGHLSTLEQPDHVNTLLLALLRRAPAHLTKNGTARLRIV